MAASSGSSSSKIRAVSFNVHMWYDATGSKFNVHDVADLIIDANADVVALQEVWHDDGGVSGRLRAEKSGVVQEDMDIPVGSERRLRDAYDWYLSEGKEGRLPLEILADRLDMAFAYADSYGGYGNAVLWRKSLNRTFEIEVLDQLCLPPNEWGLERGLQTRMCHGIVLRPREYSPPVVAAHRCSDADAAFADAAGGPSAHQNSADMNNRDAASTAPHFVSGEHVVALLCTHLDHTNEGVRLSQLGTILRFCKSTFSDVAHLLLGDFNSLVREDYTDTFWRTEVVEVRERGNWEPPQTDVTTALREKGYVDVLGERFSLRKGTCAFKTRIDFVWASPTFPLHSISEGSFDERGLVVSDHALLSWTLDMTQTHT